MYRQEKDRQASNILYLIKNSYMEKTRNVNLKIVFQFQNFMYFLCIFVLFVIFCRRMKWIEMVSLPSLGHSMSVDASLGMTHLII